MDPALAQTVADRLRSVRRARALSQRALADRSGVSLRSLIAYEQGEMIPGGEALRNLARTLACTSDELLGLRALPSPAPR